jgi:hypothetical protein
MRRVATAYAAFFICCFLLLGPAEAGWVIHSQTTGFGEKAEKDVVYFQRDRVRTDASGSTHVMDFVKRKIIMIDNKEKTYSVMTFDEFKKMMREAMSKAREAMDEMKRQGISFPGAPSPPAGKMTVTQIERATVAGYPCNGYRVSKGGIVTEDIWITKTIDLSKELGPAVRKEFEELSRDAKKMGFDIDEEENDPALRKIMESGYPMRTVDKQSGSVHEVTRVEKKTIEARFFEEPKGYKKVPYDRMTYGPSEGMPSGGEMPAWQGQTMPPEMEKPAKGTPAGEAAGTAEGQSVEYGKQTPEEAGDAATRGAEQPVQEEKRDVLDSIGEGAKEGIRKLFKW